MSSSSLTMQCTKTEIAEGRRERATPEEIMRKPQEKFRVDRMGWCTKCCV